MSISRQWYFILVIPAFICLSAPALSQSLCTFPEDSASIGIFVCDYLSHEFEGGIVHNYPICSIADTTGIPLIISSQDPCDLGWILMEYACTGDTVFRATIIWSGQGEIKVPSNFTSPDSFPVYGELHTIPATTAYLQECGEIIDPAMYPERIAAADSIWAQLSQLSVIHEFAGNEFHIILYLYPPSVGWFDPNVAKWILFIYRNPLVNSTEEYVDTIVPVDFILIDECYPNPSGSSAFIDFTLLKSAIITVRMHDVTGREVQRIPMGRLHTGYYSKQFDLSCIPSGLYVMTVQCDGLPIKTRKIAIVR